MKTNHRHFFEEAAMGKTMLIVLVGIFLLSACAQPSRLERDYGKSVKQFRANQVLNPEAGKNLDPVTGLDGDVAQITIEKYQESFKSSQEVPQPLVQTGIQTSKGKE
jgi:hypothetical protein